MRFARIAVLGILALMASLAAYAKNTPYAMHPRKDAQAALWPVA